MNDLLIPGPGKGDMSQIQRIAEVKRRDILVGEFMESKSGEKIGGVVRNCYRALPSDEVPCTYSGCTESVAQLQPPLCGYMYIATVIISISL